MINVKGLEHDEAREQALRLADVVAVAQQRGDQFGLPRDVLFSDRDVAARLRQLQELGPPVHGHNIIDNARRAGALRYWNDDGDGAGFVDLKSTSGRAALRQTNQMDDWRLAPTAAGVAGSGGGC